MKRVFLMTAVAFMVTSFSFAAEIRMFISQPEYADAINILIAEYKKVAPDVTINYETTQSDYPTLLKARLNSGDAPDIFSSTAGKEIAVYQSLTQNIADQPVAKAMTDAVRSVMMSGKEVHGFAIKGNFFGIVYNKAVFDKAGVKEFPQTFSALQSAVAKIKAAGFTPFTDGFGEWWVYKHVFQHFLYAAQPKDVEGLMKGFASGKAHFKDYPALYNDFFRFVDLVVKNGDKKPLESTISAEIAALASGKVGMVIGQGAWIEADTLKIDPNIAIGFNGYPANENASLTRVIAGGDQALRISKDSKVLKETLAFVNWWYTSDYGKNWFSQVAGVIPPIKDVAAPNFEIIKQGTALSSSKGAGTLGIVYATDGFWQNFGELMQSYVGGTETKDAVIAKIEKKWVEIEGK
jgi:raffinose/stachyose/melibiose transport system substrate-binding protein